MQNLALLDGFCIQSAMKFKGIWPNYLRKRTGNLKTHNREFFFSNREFEKLEYGIFISELGIDLGGWRGGSLCHPHEND